MVDDIHAPSNPPPTGHPLLRLIWMVSIPFMLLCVLLIANQEKWTFGRYDLVLAVLLVLAVASRALDTLRYGGTTATGEPSDRSHVIAYAARIVGLAAMGWLVAQSVAL